MQPKKSDEAQFKVLRIIPENITFNANLEGVEERGLSIAFQFDSRTSADAKNCKITIKADLHHEEHKGPFGLTVCLVGEFESIGDEIMDWKAFCGANGPAIMFPYLREIITNITTRAGRPVVLPIINVAGMLAAPDDDQTPTK